MTNIIHYEDDIFYLTYIVKKISDGLKLDLDASLFLAKIVEDISFVSRSIDFFLENLKSGTLKVNRINYLKGIYKVNKLFIELLNGTLNEKSGFARELKEHFTRLSTLREHHVDCETEIKDAMSSSSNPRGQDHEVLSEEEYRILLSHEEEN